MGYPTKIATCCYCGSRAALVLGRDRHELTCANCGAPLHDMKRFRQDPKPKACRKATARSPSKTPGQMREPRYDLPPQRSRKKRKTLMRHLFKEAIDLIEDILD